MNGSPRGELWHAIYIETRESGFAVMCIPHGDISTHDTWFDAVIGHYAHDHDFKGAASLHEEAAEQRPLSAA